MTSKRSTPLSEWELAEVKWETLAVSSARDPASSITKTVVSSGPSETSLELMEASWTFWNLLLAVMWGVSAFGLKALSESQMSCMALGIKQPPSRVTTTSPCTRCSIQTSEASWKAQKSIEHSEHHARRFITESWERMHWKPWDSHWSLTHTQRPRARTPFFDRPRTTESAGIRRRQHKTPNQMRRGFGARSLWWEKSLQGTKKPAAEKKPAGKKATPEGKKAAAHTYICLFHKRQLIWGSWFWIKTWTKRQGETWKISKYKSGKVASTAYWIFRW